jgi:uncharacterized protein YcbX
MASAVTGLALTPVKGTRLRAVDRLELTPVGARGNRRFFVIDERDRMVNGKLLGDLQRVLSDFDEADATLTMTFPDGAVIEGRVTLGESVTTRFFSRSVAARTVDGPWSAALSERLGQPLRLVEGAGSVDRGAPGAVSLISRGSLGRLAQAGGEPDVDGRRFRMLIEIGGVAAHAEDDWVGRTVRIGGALVAFVGHVGRCLVTSRNPDTGEVDLPTLDILGSYRREVAATEPLPFGIYGGVAEPGSVRVGDPVAPEG